MSLSFPLGQNFRVGGKPFIKFRAIDPGTNIFLPIPAGVVFNDGGKYSQIDLGVIGSFGSDDPGAGVIEHAKSALSKMGNMVTTSEGRSQIWEIAKVAAAGMFLNADTEQKAMYANKSVLNPNTRTTFEGNNLRNFSFNFTLVGRSPADSKAILEIHNTFRKEMYPEADESIANVVLKYPTPWEITFHEGINGAENAWLPKPALCYLTNLTTNFNPSGHMFRTDGSPTETTLELQFQETKTLLRPEIERNNPTGN
jgi:hypothetical protein